MKTVLHAARYLAGFHPVCDFHEECVFCEGKWHSPGEDERNWWTDHAEGCPWLAMPRIVAALEAAQRVVAFEALTYGPPLNCYSRCPWCDEFAGTEAHAADCPWQALVAALGSAQRGEGRE